MKGSLISTLGVFIETAVTSLAIHGKILILVVGLGFTLFPRIGSATCNYLMELSSPNGVWYHLVNYCTDGEIRDFTKINKPGFTLLTSPDVYQSPTSPFFQTNAKQDQLSCQFYSPYFGSSKQGTVSRTIKIRDDSTQAIYTITLNIELSLYSSSEISYGKRPVTISATYFHSTVLDLNGATVDRRNDHGQISRTINTNYPFNANSCKKP